MSDTAPINPTQPHSALSRVNGHASALDQADRAAPVPRLRDADEAQISERAALLSRLAEIPVVRIEVVERARELLDAGQLETPDRLDRALDALLDDLSEGL